MTSERRIAANRRNAGRSTGPRSDRGKVIASRNAVRHGLDARSPVIPAIEDPAAWDAHLANTLLGLAPDGPLETTLAERTALPLSRGRERGSGGEGHPHSQRGPFRAILSTMSLTAPRPLTVDAFEALIGFGLDPFQREAVLAYAAGHSVLVAAPTGTGKTAIAEFAALDALARGARALYTTPIKALSNQKFRDFARLVERAAERGLVPPNAGVGLLTGDLVVNPNARLLVMTTEVLRNMLVQGRATPEEAGVVVFDEVHYMGDPERGTAWEESILLSPPAVPFVCLSATVPNGDELAAWIRSAHGDLTYILHDERAVPLEHRYFVDGIAHLVVDADGRKRASFRGVGGELARRITRPGTWGAPEPRLTADLRLTDADADDDATEDRDPTTERSPSPSRGGVGEGSTDPRNAEPKRQPAPWEVLRALEAEQLTPAIYFLFSRRACEESALACIALPPLPWGMDLVREAKARLAELPPEDRSLRQVALLFRLLPRGIAVHHAGMLPVVKMLVEDLFQSGRLRAVFATDTLALGINMPARTVVVGELSKWDGKQHRLLTPNEYRQMTGRAGRRGIDARGVSVVLYSPWVGFERALAIMTGDLLPLDSAFSPSYSTALNLWRQPGDQERLADLYARSFRRYQRSNRMEALSDERDELKATFEQRAVAASADPETWEMARELAQTERALAQAHKEVRAESRALVSGIGQVLARFGYLAAERPTYKASLLRGIFDSNALTLGELIFGRYFEGLEPAEIAEVCAWFAFDREAPLRGLPLTRRVYRLREEVLGLQTKILDEERRARVTISRPINEDLKGAALAWAQGEPLGEIAERTRLAEGDLVGLLQKTIDILNQLRAALGRFEMPPRRADRIDRDALIESLEEADRLLRRGVVEASYRWALDGPPEGDLAAADWTPPVLEDESVLRPGPHRPQRGGRGTPPPRRPHGGPRPRGPGKGPGPRTPKSGPRRGR